ncbi:MAG: hypothetical protein JSS02_12145 [Planctomycetes bacterium]|nr:hypothetical protein [Planctomycetota bacterium]
MPTIDEVIDRLQDIDAALPERDGVRQFNSLYLAVTQAVKAAAATFEDWPATEFLDTTFAGLYFAALEASAQGIAAVPAAWRPLFQQRGNSRLAPLQFALAGMNAHINHDLPFALLETWQKRGTTPATNTPLHRDFERINHVLAAVEAQQKDRFIPPEWRAIDGLLLRLDDVVALWKVEAARDAAWTNGHVIWSLRGTLAERPFIETLAATVQRASQALLIPLQ